jgi:hypothetical protein
MATVINDSHRQQKIITALKQTYVSYIIELTKIKNICPEINDYAKQFIILLKHIINYTDNWILNELSDNLESILVVYIYDLSQLLQNKLKLDNIVSEKRYQNLVLANKYVIDILKTYKTRDEMGYKELVLLKQILLQI